MADQFVKRIAQIFIDDKQAGPSLKNLTAESRKLNAELSRMPTNTKEFAEKAKQLQTVNGRIASLREEIKGTNGVLGQLKGALGPFGTALAGAFAASRIIDFGRETARVFMEFEKNLTRVSAIGGEFKTRIDEISDAAKTAGSELGFTATQSLEAIEALGKAGVSVTNILGGGLEGALTLAAAGNMDVAAAAELASQAMVQFQLAGEDIPHLADLLAAGAGKASGDVTDMADALKQSGLVASQFGLDVEETVGTLSAFASNALLGSDAGTSFKNMLLKLAQPSKEAAALLDQYNIQAFDAQGNFVGMAEFAGQLQTNLADLTDEQRQSTLATIFGTDAIRAASVLYQQGSEGVAKWTAAVNDTGYAADQAAEKQNNLAGDLNKLKGAWEEFVLSVEDGNGIISRSLRGISQTFTNFLQFFTDSDIEKATDRFAERVQGNIARSFGSIQLSLDEGQLEKAFMGERIRLNTWLQEDSDFIRARMQDYADEARQLAARGAQLTNEEKLRLAIIQEGQKELAIALQERGQAERAKVQQQVVSVAEDAVQVETLKTLREELQRLKDEREQLDLADQSWLDANAKAIKSVEDRIKAIEGSSKASATATDGLKRLQDQLAQLEQEAELARLGRDEREQEQVRAKYAKLRTAAQGHSEELKRIQKLEDEEMALLRAEQARRQLRDVDELNRSIEAKRLENVQKRFTAMQQAQELELQQAEQQGIDTTALMQQQWDERQPLEDELRQAQRDAINAQYEELYAMADANGQSTVELQRLHGEALAMLNQQFADEDARFRAEQDARVLTQMKARRDAELSIVNSAVSMFGSLLQLGANNEEEFAQFQKAATLAQIAIDTASAISSMTQKGALTSLTPIDAAVKIAAGVATVLANIAKAKQLLSTASVPEAPTFAVPQSTAAAGAGRQGPQEFAQGGYTSHATGGWVNQPKLGLVGEAGREHVSPNWMVSHPTLVPVYNWLEAIRQAKRVPVGYAEGGWTTKVRGTALVNASAPTGDNSLLIATLTQLNALLSRPLPAVITYDQLSESNDRMATIENEARLQ